MPELQLAAVVSTAPNAIVVTSTTLGQLTWEPGALLAAKLAASTAGPAARAEMETVLGVILTALSVAVGDKRKAMKVNNLITQLVSEIA